MKWKAEETGTALQLARLAAGYTILALSLETGLKQSTISRIEHGRLSRPPERDTQAKLERALGVKLPITREPPKIMSVYVSAVDRKLLKEVGTKFPSDSLSRGIMKALDEWVQHRRALEKWEKEHGKV